MCALFSPEILQAVAMKGLIPDSDYAKNTRTAILFQIAEDRYNTSNLSIGLVGWLPSRLLGCSVK